MPLQPIESYVVMYSANHFPPRIWLRGAGGPLGQLVFEPNGKALEEDHETGGGQVSIYYHLDDFQNVIRLLDGKVPVYLLYSGSGGGNENGIQTASQAVAATEGSALPP